ncbi:hypothetical protein HJC99_00525 [Candidatus Saccharibacteria bacterium]|nr:hypothetical protein [Candidatus Saccharibacteria bacterium]
MKLLRIIIIIYALAILVGAYFILRSHAGWPLAVYLVISGVVIIVGVVFERGRYKPKASGGDGWEITGEKFMDATTGQWMVVRFNSRTGERDYVALDATKTDCNFLPAYSPLQDNC